METDNLAEIVRGELAQFREEFTANMAENRSLLLEIRELLKSKQ